MRHVPNAVMMIASLVAGQALAEESAPAAAKPAAVAPAEQPAKVEAAPAPAPAPVVTDAAKVDNIPTADLQKQVEEQKGILDKLNKLKVSGFIQGRYEWHDDSANGWDTTIKTPGPGSDTKSTFYIRRARLDTNYLGTNMEYVLQLDAGGDTVGLRDAEAAFIDTWTPLHLRISVGQFKYPFGYELQQSDPIREMPERARMIQKFFPGERDRGLKVQGRYMFLRFQAALVNGNGIQDPIFKSGKDSNGWLDVVGRVGVDFQAIAGGVSGYYGGSDVYNPKSTTANPDTDPLNLKRYKRYRLGADMQGSLDVPKLGALSLRGEIVYSHDKNQAYNGIAADACQDRIGLGWSVILAQNLGKYLGVVGRVDSYDPLLQGSLDSTACVKKDSKGALTGTYVDAGMDRVITWGGGLLLYVSPNLKGTFVYEHPQEQTGKKLDNDIVTAQLQARF